MGISVWAMPSKASWAGWSKHCFHCKLRATASDRLQSSTAIDLCKPNLASTLIATAATMCQTLGYHRSSTMTTGSETEHQRNIVLFWMTYIVDRSFAIRLGRPPTTRDHDIQVPMMSYGPIVSHDFVPLVQYWIRIGRIQGHIAEKLYCPAALQQPVNERSKRAAMLANGLQ